MATEYLSFNSKQLAKDKSKEWWDKILGRAKLPEDVTEFLVPVYTSQVNARAMAVVDDASRAMIWPKLTTQEQNFYNANKLAADHPTVTSFFAEQPPPRLE